VREVLSAYFPVERCNIRGRGFSRGLACVARSLADFYTRLQAFHAQMWLAGSEEMLILGKSLDGLVVNLRE